ncbi:MAG: histidine phosphatase family protein [Armatimonadota bacterium]
MITALHGLPAGGLAGAFIRHAAREPITDFSTSAEARLTPEGERNAYELGRRLPVGRPLRLYHSWVGRCEATATKIAGGFADAGGEVTLGGSLVAFAGPFIHDLEQMNQLCSRLGGQFTRAWFDGALPPEIISPRDVAAGDLLRTIEGLLRGGTPDSLTICVSHDWNVMLLRETFLRLPHEQVGWAEFLDGPVLTLDGDQLQLSWREHEVRVPVLMVS